MHQYFTLHFITVSGRDGAIMLKSASEKSAEGADLPRGFGND